jgi:hypothetical protein
VKRVRITLEIDLLDETPNAVEAAEDAIGQWAYLVRKGLADEESYLRQVTRINVEEI